MSILREELITNHLLLDYFDLWDEFDIKSANDTREVRYYNQLMNLINGQLDAGIRWLDSDDAKEYFTGETEYQREVFQALEDEWDDLLSSKYSSVDALLSEVYRRGKAKGYNDMRERIRYTEQDKLALEFVTNYNFGLIQRVDVDVRNQIKDKIISGFLAGDHPNTIAPKISAIAGERLDGSNFTPKQRATMIARTEISRVQNTGILQSYVNEGYTEVKILTAEDDHVCDLCLRYAFEFNDDEGITFENRGNEKVHNIIKLIKGGLFPPFHPVCRCTYLSVWKSKGKPPKNPFIVSLFDINSFGMPLRGLFSSALKGNKHRVSNEKLSGIDKDDFINQIKNFVDEGDEECVANLVSLFRNELPNVFFEFMGVLVNNNFLGFGDWQDDNVNIPWWIKKIGKDSEIPLVIHNHPFNTSNFPSVDDFKTFTRYGVKYGIVTNDYGTIIIKNKKIEKNKKALEIKDENGTSILKKRIEKIREDMIDDFEEDYGITFDENNSNHNKLISDFVDNHKEKYRKKYQDVLDDFDMEIKFIK